MRKYLTLLKLKIDDKQTQAYSMETTLRQRTIDFWGYIKKNSKKLREQYSKESLDKIAYDKKLNALVESIHPELKIGIYAQENNCLLLSSFTDKPYIYYIIYYMRSMMPKALEGSWLMIAGDEAPTDNPFTPISERTYSFLREVYAYFTEGRPTQLNIYSKTIDLHNPEFYYLCREALTIFFGACFTDLFLEDIRILDKEPSEGITLEQLLDRHLHKQEAFPFLPFSPFMYPCSYEMEVGNRGMRRRGRCYFPKLLDEFSPMHLGEFVEVHSPNINALALAGAKTATLYMHHPENIGEGGAYAEKVLRAMINSREYSDSFLSMGMGIGGELEDVSIFDVLITDETLFLEGLNLYTKEYAAGLIELVDHTKAPKERLQTLFDPMNLSVKELEARNASSVDILRAIERAGTDDIETRLIKGRALNGSDRFDEAIACFESCLPEASNDGRLHYGLGHAYRCHETSSREQAHSYAERAIHHYQRSVELGHRTTLALAMIAKTYFTIPVKGAESLDIGKRYLAEAQKNELEFMQCADIFYDFTNELKPEEHKYLEDYYDEHFGEPTEVSRQRFDTGFTLDLILYEASKRTKGCHVLVTRGLSSTLLGVGTAYDIPSEDYGLDTFRLELMIALPSTLPVEHILSNKGWYHTVIFSFVSLANDNPEQLSLEGLNNIIIRLGEGLEEHPYGQHSSFLLRLSPANIYKKAAFREPITLSESPGKIHFLGITPMYDEEATYQSMHSDKETKERGIFKVSPIYDPMRPNLGTDVSLDDLDLDSLMGWGGSSISEC